MRVVRVVPNLPVADVAAAAEFWTGYLGMADDGLGLDWVARFTSGEAAVQVLTSDATAPEPPVVTVHVDDVDEAHAEAVAQGYDVVLPLRTEPWGVRRFFVRTPDGHVVNVVQHRD